jgi:hypothetical protein
MIARIIASVLALGVTVSVHAAFIGMKLVIDPTLNTRARAALASEGVPDADTTVVIRLYAWFDAPGDGQTNTVLSTGFMNIVPVASGISFYQDPVGGLKAPNSAFFQFVPTLEFDTFGTIGVLDALNGDSTAVDPDASMNQSSILGGWFNPDVLNFNGAAIDQGGFFGTLLFQITVFGPGMNCGYGGLPITIFSGSIFEQGVGGAIEHQLGPLSPPCPGELTGIDPNTGLFDVNSADLAVLLSRWGPVSALNPCSGNTDLNADGVIDSGDLAILLANWGCFP